MTCQTRNKTKRKVNDKNIALNFLFFMNTDISSIAIPNKIDPTSTKGIKNLVESRNTLPTLVFTKKVYIKQNGANSPLARNPVWRR